MLVVSPSPSSGGSSRTRPASPTLPLFGALRPWTDSSLLLPPLVTRWTVVYNPVALRLLTFPLITVAAINGHCFAGGFLLALACDFRVMREELDGRRAWCCMNEVRHGQGLPSAGRAQRRRVRS